MKAQSLNRRLVEILDHALDGAGQTADALHASLTGRNHSDAVILALQLSCELDAAEKLASEIRVDDSGWPDETSLLIAWQETGTGFPNDLVTALIGKARGSAYLISSQLKAEHRISSALQRHL